MSSDELSRAVSRSAHVVVRSGSTPRLPLNVPGLVLSGNVCGWSLACAVTSAIDRVVSKQAPDVVTW